MEKEKLRKKPVKEEEKKPIYDTETTKIKELYDLYSSKNETLNAENVILISVEYDSEKNKAIMKFYDPINHTILFTYDKTGHKPYFLTNLSEEELTQLKNKFGEKIYEYSSIKKYHPLKDKIVEMKKIVVRDPLAVGGKGGLREYIGEKRSWEAWIPYHLNYIYDNNLWPFMYYDIKDGIPKLKKIPIPENLKNEILSSVEDWLKPLAEKYLPLFVTDIPKIDYMAIDIEVAGGGKIPQMDNPKDKIIAIAFSGILHENSKTVEKNFILLLERGNIKNDVKTLDTKKDYAVGKLTINGKEVEIRIYKNEKNMLLDAFKHIAETPIIVTFNGDNFDLRYIYKRAKFLGIPDDVIPIKSVSKGAIKESRVKFGIHIDLYKFYANAAIKVYSFSNKYDTVSLDNVSEALLGERKIEIKKEDIETLSLSKLASYCWWDAYLTSKLFTFNNWLPFKLIVTLSRITRMPPIELTRRGVSSWIENWFYAEHRDRNYLIPNPAEISKKDEKFTEGKPRLPPVIKGKRYRGAIVLTPSQGIWFNVWVLDFASIYPTIIKVHNISYETLCCVHEECKNNLIVISPEENKKAYYWVCTKRRGITSELIGLIRDLRVNFFKKKAKETKGDEKEFYDVVQGALKVLINASYGVFGAEHFPLFSIMVAESITGLGRFKILKIVEEASKRGLNVIYGDTDSIFISNPKEEDVKALIEWSEKNLKVDLDVDKIYKYVAFSARKKNYFGILQDGTPDIKGLLGKKRNTPEFLKKEFKKVINILRNVNNPEEMEEAKEKIVKNIIDIIKNIRNKKYSLEDLAFKIQLTKPISGYKKTTPQHVKAAKKLNRPVYPGEIISFIKTKNGVEPLEIAKIKDVDWSKYIEFTKSVFDQLLDALGLDIEKILSEAKGVVDITKFFGEEK